jgi:Hemerythrin HHE cation binding domain
VAKKTKKTAKRKSRKPASKKKTQKTAKKKIAARSAAVRKRRAQKAPPKPSMLSTSATLVRGVVAGAVATVTSKMPGGPGNPDALEILEREHRRFEELLKQGEDTTEKARTTRRELLATLTAELNAHELMEEKVLYPALQAHPQAREIVLEGFEEHHVADLIVTELHDVATNDEAWGAKFKVLKENIEHHIQEEEGNMFRLARGIFSREELRLLAARMLKIRPR